MNQPCYRVPQGAPKHNTCFSTGGSQNSSRLSLDTGKKYWWDFVCTGAHFTGWKAHKVDTFKDPESNRDPELN